MATTLLASTAALAQNGSPDSGTSPAAAAPTGDKSAPAAPASAPEGATPPSATLATTGDTATKPVTSDDKPASAEDNKTAPPPKLTYGGSVSAHSIANTNSPFDGKNQLRSFDYQSGDGEHLNLLDVWAQRVRDPVGFRLDLNWGPAARIQSAGEPKDRDVWEHLQQVYLSANLDGKKGRTYVDFGKWSTPAGLEVVTAKDNVFYGPGLLFTWSPPFYHFGGRVYHYFNDSDYAMAAVERGWNAVNNPGHAPGFILSGGKTLSPNWSLSGSYLGGDENDAFGRANWRHLLDFIALYNPNSRWAYQFNAEYGRQANVQLSANETRNANWYGFTSIARYALTRNQYTALRAEYLKDGSGFLFGSPMDVASLSLNYTRSMSTHFQTRLEYRHDFAVGGSPFAGGQSGQFKANQDTFLIGEILSY